MEKMKCPKCGKRIFDIDTKAKEEILVEAKCPHCGKIVMVFWKPQKDKQGIHKETVGKRFLTVFFVPKYIFELKKLSMSILKL